MKTLGALISNATHPESIPMLNEAILKVLAGNAPYTSCTGLKLDIPTDVKQAAISLLEEHIKFLNLEEEDWLPQDTSFDEYRGDYWFNMSESIHQKDSKNWNVLQGIKLHIKTPVINSKVVRLNDFNACLETVIQDLTDRLEYKPCMQAVFDHFINGCPFPYKLSTDKDGHSINGSSPRSEKSIRLTISKLLNRQ